MPSAQPGGGQPVHHHGQQPAGLGVWLIIYGIMEITLAFRVRSAISHVRHAVTSPA
jgi:hypothetical protein